MLNVFDMSVGVQVSVRTDCVDVDILNAGGSFDYSWTKDIVYILGSSDRPQLDVVTGFRRNLFRFQHGDGNKTRGFPITRCSRTMGTEARHPEGYVSCGYPRGRPGEEMVGMMVGGSLAVVGLGESSGQWSPVVSGFPCILL